MIERILQFILSPFWGKLSDAYGRKPVLLWSFFAHFIALVFMGAMPGPVSLRAYYGLHAVCATYSMINAVVTDWTLASPAKEVWKKEPSERMKGHCSPLIKSAVHFRFENCLRPLSRSAMR